MPTSFTRAIRRDRLAGCKFALMAASVGKAGANGKGRAEGVTFDAARPGWINLGQRPRERERLVRRVPVKLSSANAP